MEVDLFLSFLWVHGPEKPAAEEVLIESKLLCPCFYPIEGDLIVARLAEDILLENPVDKLIECLFLNFFFLLPFELT